jgi:uncharacterized membrane protein (UPF0182 family)
MKKGIIIALLGSFLIIGSIFLPQKVFCQDQTTLSAYLIAGLTAKGLIQVCPIDNGVIVYVEPLYLKNLTHIRKEKTVQAMINVARNERKHYDWVTFEDMTSHETLARGYVQKGRIDIYK